MKRLLLALLFPILCAAQYIPTTFTGSGGGGTVTYDTSAYGQSGSTSLTITPTLGTGLTNRAIVIIVIIQDTGSVTVSSVSGASASWSQFGSNFTGNGSYKGSCWVGTGPTATGSTTLTVTVSGVPSGFSTGIAYSLSGVNQSTPLGGSCQTALSGNLSVSISANDMAISVQGDNNNNRTVSGCTSSTDLTGFSDLGYSGAHCTSSPTSTFTWSGFGTSSVAVGVDVKHS